MYELEAQVVKFLWTVYQIYLYVIIAYVLLSWVPNARESFIGQLLGRVTEPYLSIFRRFIPPIGGVLDISPIIALIALRFIMYGLEAVVRFIIPG